MKKITQVIRIGAALALAFALAVGSTVSAGPVSASDCDSDPYCHWIPYDTSGCEVEPCYSTSQICCLP